MTSEHTRERTPAEPLPDLDVAALALVIDLVRRGRARTRPSLVRVSGLGRKVVAHRVDQALALGLLRESGLAPSDGGRQARVLEFAHDSGTVYTAHVGVTAMRCGIVDLGGTVIADVFEEWPVENGPDATMRRIQEHFDRLADQTGTAGPWSVAIGLPGPVNILEGTVVSPPVMPGWDGFAPRAWLNERYDVPVWTDNDANIMALGEWALSDRDTHDMLFVKIGTSIGAGVLVDGKILRGHRGAAGDIGHTHVTDDVGTRCRCGRSGCLDAIASGWALLEHARAVAADSPALHDALTRKGDISLGDIGAAARAGDETVLGLLDDSADAIATVIANLVSYTNPARVVIGGGVLQTGDRVVGRIRDRVFALCTDLVTTDLRVTASVSEPLSGTIGAAVLAADRLLSLPALSRWAAAGSPVGRGELIYDSAA